MGSDITIEQFTTFSSETAEAIKRLAKNIGSNYKELTDDDIHEMLSSPNAFIFLAKDNNRVAGMIMLLVYRIPYVKKATFEDLIVDESYRGQGIASKLVARVVSEASVRGAHYLDFTSRPRRTASNNLYEKLGFKKRETNVYRLILDYGEV